MSSGTEAPRPRRSIDDRQIDLGDIPNVQVLNEEGKINAGQEPGLDEKELLRVYRAMVLTRKLDERMLTMQRQGEMGTFAPGYGQEATQIGQVYPLGAVDWFSPSYRSFGAQLWRGWPIEHLMLLWAGYFEGFAPPADVNDLPFSIVIGSHPPVATGIAMGIRVRGDEGVVVTNFGDGAMSQGVVTEAMSFAAVFKAPVIFVVENNGYAISMPVQKQAATDHLAGRGPGLGVPAVRVDGNDILGMVQVMKEATARARAGDGPTLVEAVTYRMSLHTTADDPKVYRPSDEVDYWKQRCPLLRMEKYLDGRGILNAGGVQEIATSCEEEVKAGREKFRERAVANPREIFDYVFQNMPAELAAQREEYLAKLARKGL